MLSHTSAFQGADEQTRRRLFSCMASPHSPSRSQTCHQMCPILEKRTTTPHVSCPTCPIRAKRTTTMLISRSTCPILEKRTSKQPKNTRWMSETPESDTQSVAPLEFSYGKWRDQGWLRRTEAHRASSLLASRRLNFPTENGGATRRFEVAQVLV